MTQIKRLEALLLEPTSPLAYAHDIVMSSADGDVEPLELAVEAMLRFGDNYPAPFWVAVLREVERLAPAWRY
jgi:hypothetical protein